MWVIVGEIGSLKVYWQKWTGACTAGRPRWVTKFSPNCLFSQKKLAEKTISGAGSRYFVREFAGSEISGVRLEEYDLEAGPAEKKPVARAKPQFGEIGARDLDLS